MKLFALVGLFVMVAGVFSTTARAEVKVGDPAPDFELKASDGKTYKLSDFKDKQAVVVAWFPKAFTGGCTKECKSMRASGEKIRKYDVAYFTASVDDAKTNTEFAKSLELDYPILSDPTKKTAAEYGVLNSERPVSQRWTYYIGKDGKILHIDKTVKTDSHGEDIAAKLKELGVAEKK
jgi:peroxiredoxin Q/BCP